jgi:hypothetical protein
MGEARRIGNIASGKAIRPAGGYSVMARRRYRAAENLDYFPTPPWATRAACEFLEARIGPLGRLSVWEPACGEMHMAKPLSEYFAHVRASDVFRYRPEHELADFLTAAAPIEARDSADWVFSNPPFKLAEQFIEAGLKVARRGVAMLVRSAFIEGQSRFETLYSSMHPSFALQFCERVCMLEGRLIRANEIDPFSGDGNRASSATAYCWLIWIKGMPADDCRLCWIPPCRLKLERPGDYPEYASQALPPPEDGLFGGGQKADAC